MVIKSTKSDSKTERIISTGEKIEDIQSETKLRPK